MNELYTNGNEVKRRNKIVIVVDGYRYFNPSHEKLIANGWSVYTPPVPTPIETSKEEQYKNRIIDLVRERYSIDDELAIQRQRDIKIDEFNAYNAFVESVKIIAYNEIYGDSEV